MGECQTMREGKGGLLLGDLKKKDKTKKGDWSKKEIGINTIQQG